MAARAADRNSPHYARHECAHGRKKLTWERWSKKHLEKEQMVNSTDFEEPLQDLCRKLLRLLSNEAAHTRIAQYHADT